MSNDREFTALFAAALDAVLIIDDARVFIDVNPATEQLLGSPRAKLVGCRFDQFVDPNLDLDAEWRTFLKTGQQTGELRLVSADGTVRDVEFAATAHFLEDRHLAILRDVSDRKQGENERVALAHVVRPVRSLGEAILSYDDRWRDFPDGTIEIATSLREKLLERAAEGA